MIVLVGALILAAARADPVGPTLPWGIHIAYGSDPSTELTVMWSTRAPVDGTFVRYGVADQGELDEVTSGDAYTFQPFGSAEAQDLHLVRLAGLLPGTVYSYAVGSGIDGAGSSETFNFTTHPADPAGWVPTLAIFGDMGISSNAQDTMVNLCVWTLDP